MKWEVSGGVYCRECYGCIRPPRARKYYQPDSHFMLCHNCDGTNPWPDGNPQWKSVEDEMPKESGKMILVCQVDPEKFVALAKWEGDGFWIESQIEDVRNIKVQYWTDAPEPPRNIIDDKK